MTASERCGADVDRAVNLLRSGGVIGLPTETVYGLAADAHDARAVERIFRIKGRPADHPLIVHVPDTRAARAWCAHWPDAAEKLAAAFWPGPLTLIVTLDPGLTAERGVTGGRPTVALRVPEHPLARRVLQAMPGGLAAPSANRFGRVSPTTAGHVLDDLGVDVDYVLDGGPCRVGLESTIVDCSVDPPQILRHGAITAERIAEVLTRVAAASGPSRAPGMLESHYAPRCRVRPVEDLDAARNLSDDCRGSCRILDGRADPGAFAHDLYGLLRSCDDDGIDEAIVVLPADVGIGRAVRDRILKAAAGHVADD